MVDIADGAKSSAGPEQQEKPEEETATKEDERMEDLLAQVALDMVMGPVQEQVVVTLKVLHMLMT